MRGGPRARAMSARRTASAGLRGRPGEGDIEASPALNNGLGGASRAGRAFRMLSLHFMSHDTKRPLKPRLATTAQVRGVYPRSSADGHSVSLRQRTPRQRQRGSSTPASGLSSRRVAAAGRRRPRPSAKPLRASVASSAAALKSTPKEYSCTFCQ